MMGNVTFGVPEDLALELRDALSAKVFLETGTYKGGTSLWSSKHFDTVYTFEIDKQRYSKTVAGLSNMQDDNVKKINFIQGNTKYCLPEYLDKIKQNTIFWLDAHGLYAGNMTIEDEIPVMDELKAIFDWKEKTGLDCAILIDDARLFLAPPPIDKGYHPEYWPSDIELFGAASLNKFITLVSKDVFVLLPNMKCFEIALNWSKK